MIERLFEAGVDVFRINMSHSSFDTVKKVHAALRAAEARFERPIGILADLQGPKFRVGEIEGGSAMLPEGATYRFDTSPSIGGPERVFLPHAQIFEAVEPGHTLLLDDGKIRMSVLDNTASAIAATVVVGGILASRKGISLPDTVLPIGPLTDKDKADLDYALRLGVDWVALSFVQRGEDVKLARQLVGQAAALMSKIEKPAAINDLDSIIAHSDGLMVARGDLGVEMPVERVPGLQKQIVSKARAAGKPVVVATQMLESMIQSRPSARWTASPFRSRATQATVPSCMPRAHRRSPPPPMRSPPPRTRSPIRCSSPALFVTPPPARPRLGWRANARVSPSLVCRPWWRPDASSPWCGACIAC
jgi:pyruvate kinase